MALTTRIVVTARTSHNALLCHAGSAAVVSVVVLDMFMYRKLSIRHPMTHVSKGFDASTEPYGQVVTGDQRAAVFLERRSLRGGKDSPKSSSTLRFSDSHRCFPSVRTSTISASTKSLRWCEMVGWDRENRSTICVQLSSSHLASSCTIRNRVESARALRARTSWRPFIHTRIPR